MVTRRRTRSQRGGEGMGQPLKYTVADYKEPIGIMGRNVQGIVGPITVRPGLEASPMSGGAQQEVSPMAFEQAYHGRPLAPTGQAFTFKLPATLNQGLNMGQLGGLRKALRKTRKGRKGLRKTRKGLRKTAKRGGFYPSIMGGVVQNAPLLAPLAARQGLRLLEEYKLLSKRKRRASTRKGSTRKH